VPAYHRHLRAGGAPRIGDLPGARRLTVAESAALQTFPRGFEFVGSRSSQYSQIGNAVPPRLAEILGQDLGEYMLKGSRRRKLKAA
jgi:DNA (cytosine-5)-methyltransferase 1